SPLEPNLHLRVQDPGLEWLGGEPEPPLEVRFGHERIGVYLDPAYAAYFDAGPHHAIQIPSIVELAHIVERRGQRPGDQPQCVAAARRAQLLIGYAKGLARR